MPKDNFFPHMQPITQFFSDVSVALKKSYKPDKQKPVLKIVNINKTTIGFKMNDNEMQLVAVRSNTG